MGKSHCLSQRMAPKDPVTAPAFPSAEVPSAPVKDGVKDVANPPIIAKDAPKELVKDASKEGIDVKKSKTDSKKKVSSTVKVDVVDPAIEVKEAKVVTAEAMVEPSGVKEMTKPSILKPSAAKEMPTIPSAFKVEMPTPSTAKPSAAKEMPIIPSAAKVEVPTPSTAKPTAAKEMPSAVKVEMPMLSMVKDGQLDITDLRSIKDGQILLAQPSAAKEMSMVQSAARAEVKVPDTPPVVSSLTKPSGVSASSVQPHVEEDEVVVLMETVSKKFGEITFSDYNSAEDVDFCFSEAAADDTEDSLEWASETKRTRAKDDLAEDKVGINYIGAALDIATEQAASFRIVQAGLVIGDWVVGAVERISPSEVMPLLSSVRRSARKIRRAGERETGPFRPMGMVSESTMKMATTFLATPLALLGWEFRPVTQAKAKKVVSVEDELNQEPCTFEELDLTDYDSDMDADYLPSEESSSEDDLEFRTDAAESTEAEESVSEEN